MPFIKVKDCLTCHVGHDWLFTGATLKELRAIKQATGLTLKGFAAAADDGDPDAIAALVWILHKREKINVAFDDVDIDFGDFEQVLTDEEKAAIEEAEREAREAEERGQHPKKD